MTRRNASTCKQAAQSGKSLYRYPLWKNRFHRFSATRRALENSSEKSRQKAESSRQYKFLWLTAFHPFKATGKVLSDSSDVFLLILCGFLIQRENLNHIHQIIDTC